MRNTKSPRRMTDDGWESTIRLLLERGANKEAKFFDGMSALFGAVVEDNGALVRLLLQEGADVNAMADDGETALFGAASYGNVSMVKLLMDEGTEFFIRNKFGGIASYVAAENGFDIVTVFKGGRR